MNSDIWNRPAAGVRLALLQWFVLLLFTGAVIGYGGAGIDKAPFVGAATVVYALLVALLAWLPALRSRPYTQALGITFAMMLIIPVVSLYTAAPAMAVVLLVPALYAVIRLRLRDVLGVVLCCAVLWVLLRNPVLPVAPYRVVTSLVELLPVGLLLWVIRSQSAEVRSTRTRLTELSYRDELTGLLNMRAFARLVQSEHNKAAAERSHYALLMVDIDRLQVFNDRYGHEQGNRVIVAVADAIRRSTRSADFVARYGGDEFMVLLPGAGDDIAEVVSNRIAQNVYNITLSFDRNTQRVTVNTGRAIFPDSARTIQDMMSFADRAMYRDKDFRRSIDERKSDSGGLRRQAGLIESD